jgi:hypothetical protein
MTMQLGLVLAAAVLAAAATILLAYRKRLTAYFYTQCDSDRPEDEQRHDLRVGVALMVTALYVPAAAIVAILLLPSTALLWVLGFAVPVEILVYILYTVRFQNCGLHVWFLKGNR